MNEVVVYLTLFGFGFSALAGIGLGLILDNLNRDRKRRALGWALFLTGLPLFAIFMYLGLRP